LRQADLKLKAKKCYLFRKQILFLGYIASDEGILTDPEKVVQEWPIYSSQTEVRSFLGLCSYYRRFIDRFAEKAKPLHKLTEKERPFLWNEECQRAFDSLKTKLTTSPVLAHPDFSKPFILDTDASQFAIVAECRW